jgi:hypothetical protein
VQFGIITTPNLGVWHDRLLLLMGYQPYSVVVSLKYYNAGKFMKGSSVGREHIRFFTLKALVAIVRYHKFEILQVTGASTKPFFAPFPLSYIVIFAEKFFSHFPSLSTTLLVKFKKP